MYYSALAFRNHPGSDRLVTIAKTYDIELKVICPDSEQGQAILEAVFEGRPIPPNYPFVLAGTELVGQGEYAGYDLYFHWEENPHVHWEAGDAEDYAD